MEAKNLKVEYRVDPIGLDITVPRLSWEMKSNKRGTKQVAYQVMCANSIDTLEKEERLVWNSNKAETDKSVHVYYKGSILKPGQKVFWKVRIWDNYGEVSDWSDIAFWQMGMLKPSKWKAKWIEPAFEEDISKSTPCPYFRKKFTPKSKVERAVICISSRGLYELSLNGNKVGDELFTPGWTSFQHRLQYQVYDVTEQIVDGENAIGAILGDGWYRGYLVWQGNKNFYGNKLALLFHLRMWYSDGSKELVVSDKTWRSSTGPLFESDIYNGEIYDANQEIDGWNKSGFDDSSWKAVFEKDHGYENLVSSEGIPVRVTQTIKPLEKIITPKGELVYDLGQNIVGWVRFRLKGEKGTKVTLNHAEVLDQEGNFYTDNLRAAKAEDTYIFKGDGIEEYEPRFTFHGFRYIKVSNYKGEITLDDIEGRVVHSDMEPNGDFECSDEMVNRLQKNIQWGLRGNFLDVPTDCPQRDERLGWTGDAQVFAKTACFNMNTAAFYRKWMKDFSVDQKEDGSVPWVVPNVVEDGGGTGWSDGFGATGWADAAVIIPWVVYQTYRDERILKDQYTSMKGWVDYMIQEAGETYIFKSGFHFGDWLSFAEYYTYNYNAPDYGYAGANTDKDLIATAYFYYTTGLLEKIARVVGKNQDADAFRELLPKIKDAFCKEFMTKTGRLISGTQTAYVLALAFDLLPEEMIPIVAKRLADDVNYFGHLTTGFLGTPLICQALEENGYADIAYNLLLNKKYPSWLYPITKGATTIWERWDGIKPDGTFQTVGMNSFNHYAYGAVGNWLYTSVAGIRQDADHPGYKRAIIKPILTNKFDFVKASYKSVYGEIISHWVLKDGEVKLNITIPPNTTALVYLPNNNATNITEQGTKIEQVDDVTIHEPEGDRTVIEVGSGHFEFEFPYLS